MKNMFEIFKNERAKNQDMTIKYREIQGINELGYQNNNGLLVVKFNESSLDKGAVLYYKESGNSKGLGEKVLEIEKNEGKYDFKQVASEISKLPNEFKPIVRRWNEEYSKIIGDVKKEKMEISLDN